jgi:tol-pal system protein YbgF
MHEGLAAMRMMKKNERSSSSGRWLVCLVAATSVFVFSQNGAIVGPVQAEPVSVETRALYNRLEKLERDLIDVQRQTYQSGGSSAPASAGAGFGPEPSSVADLSLRLQAAEESLRALNGRIEELTYNLAQTQGRFRQFSEDVEFRFQELGSAGGRTLVGENNLNQPPLVRPDAETASAAMAATVGTLGSVPVGALPPAQNDNAYGQAPAATDGGFGQVSAPAYSPAGYPPAGGASQEAGPEDAYEAAINQLKRGQFDIAEAELANFLQRYPTHNLAGNAQYWLGETFYVRGAYRQAAEAFLTGYTTYASSVKAPDSLLKLGMTLAALGQQDQACATLGELTRRFPSASQAVSQRAQLERSRAGC